MADDGLAVASVQVGPLDDVVLGVHPIHAVARVVDGEAVGPEQVRVRDDAPVGAVHVGVLDARRVAPVGPVDLPEDESGPVKVRRGGKELTSRSGQIVVRTQDTLTKRLFCSPR